MDVCRNLGSSIVDIVPIVLRNRLTDFDRYVIAIERYVGAAAEKARSDLA
jgi:hypothetical protein